MALPALLLPAIVDIAGRIFDRVIPDKAGQEKAKAEFLMQAQSQEFQLMLGQLAVNTEEAKHASLFIAGWRPFIGWMCGAAMAYTYIILPFLQFAIYTWGTTVMVNQLSRLPKLDLSELAPILIGMLGLGVMRTWEKTKGVS